MRFHTKFPRAISLPGHDIRAFEILNVAGLLSEDSYPSASHIQDVEAAFLDREDEAVRTIIETVEGRFGRHLHGHVVWVSSEAHCSICGKRQAKAVIMCEVEEENHYPHCYIHSEHIACCSDTCFYQNSHRTTCFEKTCAHRYLDPDPPEGFYDRPEEELAEL